jgi:hypothetical protein
MTLENLAKIGSIKVHEPSQSELLRLLDASKAFHRARVRTAARESPGQARWCSENGFTVAGKWMGSGQEISAAPGLTEQISLGSAGYEKRTRAGVAFPRGLPVPGRVRCVEN